ncbi:hypothetical protein AAHA92_17276 [Salvia divinorum]|uniref:Retrotransposon gag domain-containing protein n=1 Tax=Salvia divinorum TaxID=28513 RepID=A0ABD1GZH6_SALDI
MAAMNEEDPEIGSLNAHLNDEPSSAIVVSAGQSGIEVKNNVLARRPAGSSEEDYRLRALHFALKGEADTWFMRLPPNSIRTWNDFRAVFLEYFFPATRTNALKKEIQGATQEDDETLSQYWDRFKGMLDACPNNRMSEAEIYNNFYEGMTPECKDLVNSASGGDFSRLRVSEAKHILSRLINAKKAYDSPRTTLLRHGTVNTASEQPEDRMEARMDKLEKAIISALEKTKQATPTEKCQAPLGPEESNQLYNPLTEGEYPAQVYAAGSWNANGSWNPGKQRDAPWRDHPNFRWSDANLNQPAPQTRSDPPPLGTAPQGRYNQGTGSSGNFHPQGQGYNHYQNQRGNSHINQGHGYNQSASGSGQPFQRPQQGHIDNYSRDLLNNDVVNKLQDTQNEHKAALDMFARQLSQIATSISEMRGNEGKIPATVKMPGKENISSVDLRPNEEQVRPQGPLEEEKSSGGIGQLIKETEEVGVHKKPEEAASDEGRETKETEEVPNEVKENISMIATKQRVPTKHSDPGMFTLPISIGNNEIIRAMCDLGPPLMSFHCQSTKL